jgi:hypothetical protein
MGTTLTVQRAGKRVRSSKWLVRSVFSVLPKRVPVISLIRYPAFVVRSAVQLKPRGLT